MPVLNIFTNEIMTDPKTFNTKDELFADGPLRHLVADGSIIIRIVILEDTSAWPRQTREVAWVE